MIEIRSSIHFKDFMAYILTVMKRRKDTKLFIFIYLAASFFILFALLYKVFNGTTLTFNDWFPAIVLGVLTVGYILLFIFVNLPQYKKNKESYNLEVSYHFLPTKMMIGDINKGVSVLYDSIVEVIEGPKRLYFITQQGKIYIANKNFINGDINELRILLKNSVKHGKLGLKTK